MDNAGGGDSDDASDPGVSCRCNTGDACGRYPDGVHDTVASCRCETDVAAGRGAGDALVTGGVCWHHNSKPCGTSGSWAGVLSLPPLPVVAIAAPPLPVVHSPTRGTHR